MIRTTQSIMFCFHLREEKDVWRLWIAVENSEKQFFLLYKLITMDANLEADENIEAFTANRQ